ncbi:MAG TPA: N-acyl homoserine lactonase family protein [bacterium]|nr:N-acyl homoserine lactonase family protein [bacterium]
MRLYIMQLGMNPDTGNPYPGYLIQTDDGTNILVDTGFGPKMVETSRRPDHQGPRVTEDDLVVNQLARLGVRPENIRYLVATHFDGDHAGYLAPFTAAEIVVQRRHYDTAQGGHPRFAGTREQWGDPRLRYRLVDGDTTLVPGVELIETSGHVPGHQSVLVRLPKTGPVLLAIDAMARALGDHTPETRPIGSYDLEAAGTRASTRKLVDLAARERVALIVYGHDPDEWKKLKKAPEFYE